MALTTNKNFLSPVGFNFRVDNINFPNLEYFCTAVTLPGISLGDVPVPYKGINLAFTGDRIGFEDLAVRFNITENMENYIETFNWIHDIVNGTRKDNEMQSDAILIVLNSHLNKTKEIHYKDVFPTSLSGLEFDVNQGDIEYLTAEVTFKYTYFEIK